ncbi:MAG TPA: YbjQ family protein [bacterium]|nr:YbjQ family protein [bacterium]HPJ71639.1 YbjQ family protein [bacterium]HPQ65257.1 YbjQ family protein [bacterium]
MIFTNTDNVPGREITEVIGIVRGNVVGAAHISESLISGIKKALASALSWGPKIVTGEDVGVPVEPPAEPAAPETPPKPYEFEGELDTYSDLLFELRERALKRLRVNASNLGADAVINIHFDVTVIMMHAFEVCVYGTAVKLG